MNPAACYLLPPKDSLGIGAQLLSRNYKQRNPETTALCETVAHIPANIDNSITSDLYRGCTSLTTVTMDDAITYIAGYAFCDCKSLTSVTLANSLTTIHSYAFRGCTSLPSIVFPDRFDAVYEAAFMDCYELQSVSFPAGIRSICSAFNFCYKVEFELRGNPVNFRLSSDKLVIYSADYLTVVVASPKLSTLANIDSKVQVFSRMCFQTCKWVGKVMIPDSVIKMGQDVFSSSSALTEIYFGSGVAEINSLEFRSCANIISFEVSPNNSYFASLDGALYNKALENMLYYPIARSNTILTLPTTIKSFGTQVFVYGCKVEKFSLTNGQYLTLSSDGVTLYDKSDSTKIVRVAPGYSGAYTCSDTIKTLGPGSFSGCKVASLTMNNVEAIQDWALYGTKFPSLNMDKITYVGGNAFHGSAVQIIRIPNQATFLGGTTAYSGVKTLTIDEGVVTIGGYSSQYAGQLTSVSLPDSVEQIQAGAFRGTALADVRLPEKRLHTIGQEAFMSTKLVHIRVPMCVKWVDNDAFGSCGSAESAEVANCNTCCYRYAFRSTEDRVQVYCVATLLFTQNPEFDSISNVAWSHAAIVTLFACALDITTFLV